MGLSHKNTLLIGVAFVVGITAGITAGNAVLSSKNENTVESSAADEEILTASSSLSASASSPKNNKKTKKTTSKTTSKEPTRVAGARDNKSAVVAQMFQQKGVAYPPERSLLRIFKQEGELEVWAADTTTGPLTLIKTYPICAASGDLGPKQKEGDGQVPEGFYSVESFNPYSNYHLALRVSYPNAVDKARNNLGPKYKSLGGDIMIHGNCVTIGCIPMTDDLIEEIYLIANDTRRQQQGEIEIHSFPMRMTPENLVTLKQQTAEEKTGFASFWENLAVGYDLFEKQHKPLKARADEKTGLYRF